MSSVEHLREFVNERLTAAAEEIFRVFKTTVIKYEEEIDRQRKLLDIFWKPEIKLHRIELRQQHVCKEEEVLADQQLCNQDSNSSLEQDEPEPPQIKEEQEELCTRQEGDQRAFTLTPIYKESDQREPELKNDNQLFSHSSHVAESQDQKGAKHGVSGSTRHAEPLLMKRHYKSETDSNNGNDTEWSEIPCGSQCKKPFKCDTCGKAFKQKSTMRRHMRVHTGEKPYLCNICGKRFSDASFLKPHMTIHTGEKPYSCKTCGKDYRFGSAFKVHLRTHTGERPYTCNTCKREFYSSSHLKIHMRTHTGEKPYACKTCERAFTNSGSLKVHMRRHTGEKPYLCKTCGKRFCDMPALKKHTRIHTGEKPYTCTTCGRAFRRSSGMNRHMKTHRATFARPAGKDLLKCQN